MDAIFLFETFGFVLVAEDLAVRSIAFPDFTITAFVERAFGGNIFQSLRQIRIVRHRNAHLQQDAFSTFDFADIAERVCKFDGEVSVLGVSAHEDFKRQDSGLRHL